MNKQELLVKYKKLWDIKGDGVWWEKLIDEAIIIGKQEAISEFKEIIDEEIEEEHKAEKNNRNSIPPWTIYKELVYLKRRLDKTAQEIMG